MFNLIYLLAGLAGGLIVGFIGTGSSLVILPVLSIIFAIIFPYTIAFKLAVGTCIATIAIGAIIGAIIYAKKGYINKRVFWLALPSCLLGGIIGPIISHFLSSEVLKYYIGIFLVGIAIYKLIDLYRHKDQLKEHLPLSVIVIAAFIAAVLSSIAGVAIGILFMPVLHYYLPPREVSATSLGIAACYASIAAITYILIGFSHSASIPNTFGYLYLPAFIFLAIGTTCATPIGIKLANKTSAALAKRIFYYFLFAAGVTILMLR